MEWVSTSPDEYLATLPEETRGDMTSLHERIAAALPGHRRSLWEGVFWGGSAQSIIGYGDYSYVRSDKKPVGNYSAGMADVRQGGTIGLPAKTLVNASMTLPPFLRMVEM